jgi:ABC-type proline/glycine betaine transport system ATPase subunit
MDRLAEMVQYVRQKNIDHYRKLLDEPTDPLRRQQLQQQLAELERDAAAIARPHGPA